MVNCKNFDEEEIKKEYERLSRKFTILKYRGLSDSDEYREIKNQLLDLRNYCLIMNSKHIVRDGNIDIYEGKDPDGEKRRRYYIAQKDTTEIMGLIFVNYDKYVPIYGNIGYQINEEYQGQNLSLRALNLITPTLIKNGMEEAIICIRPYNEPSIKIAEKFGCSLVKKSKTIDGINKYVVNLKEKSKISDEKNKLK